MKHFVIFIVENGKQHECFSVNKYPPCWQGLQQGGIRLLAMNFMTLTLTTVLHGCFNQTIDILERLPPRGEKLKQRTLHRTGEGERVKIPWACQRGRLTKTHHVWHWRVKCWTDFPDHCSIKWVHWQRCFYAMVNNIRYKGHLYICKNEHQFFKAHTKIQLFNQGRTLIPVPLSTEKLKARPCISSHIGVQRNHLLSSSWMQ